MKNVDFPFKKMLPHDRVTSAVIILIYGGGGGFISIEINEWTGWAVKGGDAVGLRHHQPRARLPLSLSLFTPLSAVPAWCDGHIVAPSSFHLLNLSPQPLPPER